MKLKIFFISIFNIFLTKNTYCVDYDNDKKNNLLIDAKKIFLAIKNIDHEKNPDKIISKTFCCLENFAHKDNSKKLIEKGLNDKYIERKYIVETPFSSNNYTIFAQYFKKLIENTKKDIELYKMNEAYLKKNEFSKHSSHGFLGKAISVPLMNETCCTLNKIGTGIESFNENISVATASIEKSNDKITKTFLNIVEEITKKELLIDSAVLAISGFLLYLVTKKTYSMLLKSILLGIIILDPILFIKNDHTIVLHIKAFFQACNEWIQLQKRDSRYSKLFKFVFSYEILIILMTMMITLTQYASEQNTAIKNIFCSLLADLIKEVKKLTYIISADNTISESIQKLQNKLNDETTLPRYIPFLQNMFEKINANDNSSNLKKELNSIANTDDFFSCIEFTNITEYISELAPIKNEINFDNINKVIQELWHSKAQWDNILIIVLDSLFSLCTFLLNIDKPKYNLIFNPIVIKIFLLFIAIIVQKIYDKPLFLLEKYSPILLIFLALNIICFIIKKPISSKKDNSSILEENNDQKSFFDLYKNCRQMRQKEFQEKVKANEPAEQFKKLNFFLEFQSTEGDNPPIMIPWTTQNDYLYYSRLVQLKLEDIFCREMMQEARNDINMKTHLNTYKERLENIKELIQQETISVDAAYNKSKEEQEPYLHALEYFLSHNDNDKKTHLAEEFSKRMSMPNYKTSIEYLQTLYNRYYSIEENEKISSQNETFVGKKVESIKKIISNLSNCFLKKKEVPVIEDEFKPSRNSKLSCQN